MAQLAVAAVMFVGAAYQGLQEKSVKQEEARGYRDAAIRRFGASTHEAREEERNKEFMYSRALAAGAASGTSASSVGIVNRLADLNAEGEWRVAARLWQGRTEAEGFAHQADQAEKAGDAMLTGRLVQGITSAVSAYAGFGSPAGKTKSAMKAASKR